LPLADVQLKTGETVIYTSNFWGMSLSNFILIHFRVWHDVKHKEKNAST